MPYVHYKDAAGRWITSPYFWNRSNAEVIARRIPGAVVTDSAAPPADPPAKRTRARSKKAEQTMDAIAEVAAPKKRRAAKKVEVSDGC
jgi:hypothetical protein